MNDEISQKSSFAALKKAQKEFEGVAEELRIKNDADILNMISELRDKNLLNGV